MTALTAPTGAVVDVPDAVVDDYLDQGYIRPGSSPTEPGNGTPGETWTVKQLDAYAADHGLDLQRGLTKAAKLEVILDRVNG